MENKALETVGESKLRIFEYMGSQVRVVMIVGEPWWIAKDVADILGFRMASDMTRLLDDDEKGTHIMRTPGGEQTITIINEPGLYSAILKSRKPEAKAFKRWVTHDVLPSIRKQGFYMVTSTNPNQAVIDLLKSFNTMHTMMIDELETQKKELEEVKSVTSEQEKRLREIEERPKENQRIRKAVNERVKELSRKGYSVYHGTIYKVLHEHFGVSTYSAIPLDKTDEAIEIVKTWRPKYNPWRLI